MKMTSQNSFRLSVILGLAGIILLVVVLAGVGLWRMTETSQQVEQVVSHQIARTDLVHRMQAAMRERKILLQQIVLQQEPGRLQELTRALDQQGAIYLNARHALEDMPHSDEEQALFKELRAQAAQVQPFVAEILDHATQGRNERAQKLLDSEVEAAQRRIAAGLDKLLAVQKRDSEIAISESRKTFEFTRLHILILASFVIGACLMAAPVVIRMANRQTEEGQQQAMYDSQTQLPNRLLLIDRLRQNVRTARHEQRSFGLLRIDIDRFSSINSKFGRAIGDQVLQYVAACIQGCLNEPDTLARMDGDEFAVLSMSVTDLDQAIALAQQIRQSIHQPLEIGGRQLGVTASVGVVMFPHHGDDPETLLSAAGEALRLARQTPRGYRIFSADMKAGVEDRVALVHELRDAIANNGLALHYQPKVDIGTDQVSGVEALVRWPHPANGLMLPEQFLPLAEQIDLIQPLTDWVLETAMQQVQAWRREGVQLPVSVKITAASVQNPEFPQQMAERLRRLNVPATSIEIELKDSSAITDSEQALNCLRLLKEMGFQIAIGDFGTGDSPMMFLTEYLVANIKLDKALVQSMAENKGGIMAVRSAVNLGHTLGLQVVAKGVESQDSWNVLRGFGCNSAQGFYMSGPLSPPDLINWLQSSPRVPAAHGA